MTTHTISAVELAALKPGDIAHIRVRVVEVFPSDMTVDVMGSNARFRIHPHKALISGIEPAAHDARDVLAELCGSRGRVLR